MTRYPISQFDDPSIRAARKKEKAQREQARIKIESRIDYSIPALSSPQREVGK